MKKLFAAIVVILSASIAAYSLGDKEAGDYEPVKGIENWQHAYDISAYKQGTYNLVVRGTDKAGNVFYAGPYDVYIDPASDIPAVNINYPLSGIKVGSRLNIVGTALDDDGVKAVEVKLDDGEWRAADGKEFWSFYINLDSVPDGKHTVMARCFDLKNVGSAEKSVSFHLDKKAPDAKVTAPLSGALVTGEIAITGSVVDLNGLRSLAYSTDGRKRFTNIGFSYKGDEQKYVFEQKVDTKTFTDGPLVVWLKSVDEIGVTGYAAVLLFVNNERPLLEILSPANDEIVNNSFRITGRSGDKIGIKSLTCDLGSGKTEPVEVIPGNPFWTKDIDLSAFKGSSAEIGFIAENFTGNKETKRIRVRLDAEKDKPVVTVSFPQKDAVFSGDVAVSGFASDDDLVRGITYSVDKKDSVILETGGPFSFALRELTAGKHTLSVKPVDINGTEGKAEEISFSIVAAPPAVRPAFFLVEKDTMDFFPGVIFSQPEKNRIVLKGTIDFPNGADNAEYMIRQEGDKYKPLSLQKGETDSSRTFEVELGKELPEGRIDFAVKAADKAKLVTEYATFFYKGIVTDKPGLYFMDPRIKSDGAIQLRAGDPLLGFLYDGGNDSIKSAELVPQIDNVKVEKSGSTVIIKSVKEGAAPAQVKVTSGSGKSYTSETFRFITDFTGPDVEVKKPATGAWLSQKCDIEGVANDPSGIKTVEYSVKGMEGFTRFTQSAKGAGVSNTGIVFKETIDISGQADGDVMLIIRVTDSGDNPRYTFIPFKKDTKPPVASLIAPLAGDELNGLVTLSGIIEDGGAIASVEFTEDNASFTMIGSGKAFKHNLNLAKYPSIPKELGFRITDKSGNAAVFNPKLTINAVKDKPQIEIQLPQDKDVMRDDFILSGMAYDDDGIKAVYYRIDDAQFVRVEGTNGFAIPIQVATLADKTHVVEVKAEDLNGLTSEISRSTFVVSKAEPESQLLKPALSEHVREIITLSGTSKDENGIREVYVSFDNGLTFNRAEGREEWRYSLDTRLLADGTQSILVRAVDNAGTEGLYSSTVNVDNHSPVTRLDSPKDGEVFTDSVFLDGKSYDSIALMSLQAVITPLAGSGASEAAKRDAEAKTLKTDLPIAENKEGIFTKSIDVSKLQSGWYNIKLTATDRANNSSYSSCDIQIKNALDADKIELAFPVKGESLSGFFAISGKVTSRATVSKVSILVDGVPVFVSEVNGYGYFFKEVGPAELTDGVHSFRAEGILAGEVRLVSDEAKVSYTRTGPWVTVTNVATGDFVNGRPVIQGKAGFYLDPVGEENKDGFEAYRKALEENVVESVYISFDNGRSFTKIEGTREWRYRLDAYKLQAGNLRVLVKADFRGGISAFSKVILTVDNKPPQVVISSPDDGGRYNESISLAGVASDENGVKEVSASLRQGDKGQYSVPEFIQGAYIDAKALGNTLGEVGLGFTFFQQNVKLQAQLGFIPAYLPEFFDPGQTRLRFYGLAIGAKLLANIFKLPFGFLLGPDWEFFSMSLALGANFSYFTMSESSIAFTDKGVIVGSVLAQFEFARFTIEKLKLFNSYAFYTEFSLSFISSDIQAGFVPKISGGFRIGIF